MSATLLESPLACEAFGQLFRKLYGVSGSILPLGQLLHWRNRLGIATPELDAIPTFVFGGYFYGFSSPVPEQAELSEVSRLVLGKTAGQILVPCVREGVNVDALVAEGFQKLPWFVESVFEIDKGVEADLASRVSRNQRRDILRLTRRSEEQFELQLFEGEALRQNPWVFAKAAELHAHNLTKYSHALNFYSQEILTLLLHSGLAEHLLIALRKDKNGEFVQASVNFIDRPRKQLFLMVQGINRDLVPPGQNLYLAETYQLYQFAQKQGIQEVYLGRGGQEAKQRMGANRFHLLNLWIKSQGQAASEFAAIVEKSQSVLATLPPDLRSQE